MEIYFDNSATTRCYTEVKDLVSRLMTEDFGNPSAMHQKGVKAERYMKEAAASIAGILKAKPEEILFTSGGTESDNLALIGTALALRRRGRHIIISQTEHAAVREPAEFLKKEGFEVSVLPVDAEGVVRMDVLSEMLRPDTILVSVMYVNNETGTVMPVREIAGLVHEKSPLAYFHTDAVQAFGKYRICPSREGIDLLSVSSHKLHGPKGAGFLYIRKGVRLQPLILGGGQQNGMRSGTDNVPGVAGMGLASVMVYEHLEDNNKKLYGLKKRLQEGLSDLEGITLNGMPLEKAAPHIMSITFDGIRSEVLLHSLEDRGIYVSAGSACSSHKRKPSATLSAMGLPGAALESTIRVSFSDENTEEEVDSFVKTVHEIVPMLRRYARK